MMRIRDRFGRVVENPARVGWKALVLIAGASLAMPLAAQKVPVQLNHVRRQVNPKAAAKQTRSARKAEAGTARPGSASVRTVAMRSEAGRRDPFAPLVREGRGGGPPVHLPPGIAGLQIGTLQIEGLVKGPNGMIAVVSNPDGRVYFLRDGDHVYNGQVQQISMTGVEFNEVGKDAFGRPIQREVIKRLYPTSGDQK